MRLNKPHQALMWEEFLVGGSISSIVIFLTLFVFALGGYVPDTNYPEVPQFIKYLSLSAQEIEYTVLLMVSLLSILLVLNIGNTGEMLVGFPMRILRYPVPTRLPVIITLYSRLFYVLLFALILRVFLAGMFWDEASYNTFVSAVFRYFSELGNWHLPISTLLLVHGSIYMFLQVMAWLLGWSLVHFTTVILYLVLLVVCGVVLYAFEEAYHTFLGFQYYRDAIDAVKYMVHNYSIPFLILLSLFTLYLGIKIVEATRHRRKEAKFESFYSLFSWVYILGQRLTFPALSSFSSRYLAQLWYELRKTGFIIPLWSLILWLLGFGVFFFFYNVNFFLGYRYGLRGLSFFMTDNFAILMFLILPHTSFWVGSIVWALMNTRRFFR